MLVNSQNYRTVWMQDSSVYLINQQLLPHKFEIYQSKNHLETTDAIKTMIVRGAPAIGATGAFGIAQAAIEFTGKGGHLFYRIWKTESISSSYMGFCRPTVGQWQISRS